jgi:drug/metabolite transporter (DMT)-like permease
MNRDRLIVTLKVLFAVFVWGGSFIATKIALRDIAPLSVVWIRFLIGVTVLAAAVKARGQFALPSPKDLAYFALLGGIGITFHQWLQSTGLQTAQASTTAWIVASTPIFMALLGWLFLRERLTALRVFGILLAAGGVLLVVSRGDLAALSLGCFGAPGDALILISSPNWAIFSTLSRGGLQRHPAARMMLYVMGFGWLLTSLFFFSGPGLGDLARLTLDGWLAVAFLGLACSGLAYIFWYDALQALPAAQVGAFLYLEPLVTVFAAALMLAEPLTLATLLGGVVILLGVWLVNRRQREVNILSREAEVDD